MGVANRETLAARAYRHLLQSIELVMDLDPEDGTPECDLFIRLVDAVEAYERATYPLPAPEERGAVG